MRRLRRPGVPPRWALALGGAVLAAEWASLLMRPRGGLISAPPVPVSSFFSRDEIARAQNYSRPQLALYLASVAVEGAILTALVWRPPRRLADAHRRPLLTGALVGGALSLLLSAAPLPLAAIARQRSLDAGLATQSWGGWGVDLVKSMAIGAVLAGAGAALALGLMRRLQRSWWVVGSALVVLVGAGFLFAAPVILDPLFNRFTPLPRGGTRSDVLALARRAGVRVGQIYEVDASRRTTAANAYVTGLGATKRVVLYDTLLAHFSRDETRLVVAHELGHVHYQDVSRGLIYLALVAPVSLLAAAQLTRRLSPRVDHQAPGPEVLPALALSLALVTIPVGAISNGLSRRVEARADAFALRLTGSPAPFISFERRITLRNLADPDPPAWLSAVLATHPSTVQRIGIARAYEAGVR